MRIFQEKKIVTLTLLCFLVAQTFWTGAFAEEPETSEEPELPPELSGEQQTASFDPAALELASQSAVPVPDTISLELKGVDVLDVLKILAARSGLNIVAGTNVRGPVTIYLKEVSVEQALDTIVSALGLAYEEDQQIIKVMTRLEYEALHGRMFRDPRVTRSYQLKWADLDSAQALVEQLKSPQGKIVADPRTKTMIVTDRPEINDEIANLIGGLDQAPITRSFRIQYARAEDLEKTLADYLTGGKGILKIDKRTNQVTVTDRQEVIDQIATVISSTDVRPAQVLIEAQVIEVALFDAFRWGIDWDYVRSKLIRDIDLVSLAPNFDVTAPTSALLGSGTLSTFTFSAEYGLDAVLRILQNVGKTNTLSAPRITVMNNEEAKLADATKEPYVTSTVVQGDTTSTTTVADTPEFIDVGVTLTVVPTITEEGTVVLKLKPEVSTDTGDFTVPTASGSVTTAFNRTIPIIATQSLETTVIVKSGETLVVGGLIKDSESKLQRKLPLLGDIPILGALFRSEQIDFRKTELVIFLTPHIISGDYSTREYGKFFNSEHQLIDFDKVGGFDYGRAQEHSQGPFRKDKKPYWEVDGWEIPQYLPEKNLHTRIEPYEDRMDQFEGFKEGDVVLDRQTLLGSYQAFVTETVRQSIKAFKELESFKGTLDIALLIRRDGVVEDASFVGGRANGLENRKLKRQIVKRLKHETKFPEFPKGLDSQNEMFLVTLASQGENAPPKD